MAPLIQWAIALAAASYATAKCYDPSPAFPVPSWNNGAPENLQPAFQSIQKKLEALVADKKFDASSFSVAVTSSSETLWSQYHTAREHNKTRPGDMNVDEDSIYRIASITKTFTTLAILQQQKAGNLSLDDPIDKYIPELAEENSGALPWKDITLRILASQLSGIPREFTMSDLAESFPDPTIIGFPPAKGRLQVCERHGKRVPCTRKQLLDALKAYKPVFAPNQKSTYSNIAFEILGLVIENVSGLSYEEYIQEAIFDEVGMPSATISSPRSDGHAVLPVIPNGNFWDNDLGIQNPTGGIFVSSADLTKYVRYIVTHFNSLVTGVNWLMPASWSVGMNSFYGMPFEIFRTEKILKDSNRPVTFVTKGGSLPGYYSLILILEEYGLGITLLVGGQYPLLAQIREIVTVELVQHAEAVIWRSIENTHAKRYTAVEPSLNSSLELAASPSNGLTLNSFISNGTDIFKTLIPIWVDQREEGVTEPWRIQLVPTYLYKNETNQQGEIWRMTISYERDDKQKHDIWDDFCIADIDPVSYDGLPVTEIVFWHEEGKVELPAWQVMMEVKSDTEMLEVQIDL
ncbi:beta-lactamase-like protein [Acrodontium crateriforme]|uniref:Beta-lactamase-like protein n=1 Tax=Acrodontium crateriforme TaxID=150365 RepID=A0AAQ3M1Q3_9PEZI|nr:beta-lactamase-like protein [Acrodontium crateriforme]